MDERVVEKRRIEREQVIGRLRTAYQRRELHVFEECCRPDMVVTLAGSSRLAGTHHGYGAFSDYLTSNRGLVRSAGKPITFEHDRNEMVVRDTIILSGDRHQVEMGLRITVRFHYFDGRIESFLVEPEDQALFDHVVDSKSQVAAGAEDAPHEPRIEVTR